MSISAAQVKNLREKTGVGMMECKNALVEAGGDEEKAILILRERGMNRAAKKAGRVTSQGLISLLVDSNQLNGTLIEVNCETDFVSENKDFKTFVNDITKLALDNKVTSLDELNSTKMQNNSTVKDNLTQLIAKIGENLSIKRLSALSASNGIIGGYLHFDSTIGALVSLEGEDKEKLKPLANDIAMHIAAAAPRYLERKDVATEELNQEQEIARKKLLEQGKPENLIDKIITGQMNKFYKEICLVEQAFVKDPKQTINGLLKNAGPSTKIVKYQRFQLGL